jgi:hypothetical protein
MFFEMITPRGAVRRGGWQKSPVIRMWGLFVVAALGLDPTKTRRRSIPVADMECVRLYCSHNTFHPIDALAVRVWPFGTNRVTPIPFSYDEVEALEFTLLVQPREMEH